MTGALRRRAARVADARQSGDAGLSLVELLVSMMIAGVLFTAVGAVFLGTLRAINNVNVKTSTSADTRIAMEAMSRAIRVAYQPAGEAAPITVANTNALSFYALLNRTGASSTAQPLPTLVEYYYSSGCLYEAQTPARTLSSPPSGGPYYAWDTGRVAKCLMRTSAAPVFSYYTSGALSLSGTPVAAITVPAGGLSLTARNTVESVEINLTAQDPKNPKISGIPVDVRVTMENVRIADGD